MHSFQDKNGKKWNIELNVGTCEARQIGMRKSTLSM